MFVLVILGSDKTTVSVATGQHEYYPIYLSIGNIHNNILRAHKNALVLIGFLPIPKGNRYTPLFLMLTPMTASQKDTDTEEFHDFKRHLFHGCLRTILKKLEWYMTKWDIVRCTDNHFRQVIYGIGPYITDYPEQGLVVGIMNSWCPAYLNSLLARLACLKNYRCDGPSTNLDTTNAEPQTQEKAERLFETKSNDDLWFNHGLIGDLHVCLPYVSTAQFG